MINLTPETGGLLAFAEDSTLIADQQSSERLYWLQTFASFLHGQGVRYVTVGPLNHVNTPMQDEDIHDCDIVIDNDISHRIPALVRLFCKQFAELQLIQLIRHETNAWFCVICIECKFFLHFDICGDFRRNNLLFIHAKELLDGAALTTNTNGRVLKLYVPPVAQAFRYYLLKKLDKGSLNEAQGSYLHALATEKPDECRQILDKHFPIASATLLFQAAITNHWQPVQQAINVLRDEVRKTLSQNHPSNVQTTLLEMGRVTSRLLRPTGLSIAILGPDGSGKSTIIQHLHQAMAPVFRKQHTLHLRPRVGMATTQSKTPVTSPYSKPPYSPITSVFKLIYLAMDYIVGYWLTIWPKYCASTCLVFDRYYDDILCDPRRYRYQGSHKLIHLIRHWIPKPDITIILDAPEAVLQQRKQEVSPEESQHQRANYLKHANWLTQNGETVLVVSTANTPEQCTTEIKNRLLTCLAQRTEERYAN